MRAGNRVRRLALGRLATGAVGSGAKLYGGRFAYETADDLRDPLKRHQTYELMAASDPYVAEALAINTLPLVAGAAWSIEPPIECVDAAAMTPLEKQRADIAEFCSANLLCAVGETYGRDYWHMLPWSQHVNEALRMLRHGFALFHKEWRVVNGTTVYRRLHYIEPWTIWKWQINENDEIEAVVRNYIRPDNTAVAGETIPVEELALYVWDMTGARYEGLPMIRPMFGAFKRRNDILRWKMIAAQRASVGLPFATWNANGQPGNAQQLVETFLAESLGDSMSANYLAGTFPEFKAGYLTQDARGLEVFDSMAKAEEMGMSHAGGTKSQMLGEGGSGGSGSRALGDTMQRMQWALVSAIAQVFREQCVNGVGNVKGVLADLVDRNFAGVDAYPTVRVTGIDPEEETRDLPLIYAAMQAGALPKHPSVQQAVARRLKLDLPDEAFEVEEPPMPAPPPGPPGAPPAPGAPASSDDGEDEPAEPEADDAAVAPPKTVRASVRTDMQWPASAVTREQARAAGYGRVPTEFESKVMALGQIASALGSAAQGLAAAFKSARRAMVQDIVARGRAGKISRATIEGFRRSKPRGATTLEQRVRMAWVSAAASGEQHAKDELARQKPAGTAFEVVPPGAALPPGRRQAPPGLTIEALQSELETEARLSASIEIDWLWHDLVTEAIDALDRVERSGATGAEKWDKVEEALSGLSDKPLDGEARKTATAAYNEGRDFAAKQALINGEAGWAMRSEVLDSQTCESCAGLDGTMCAIDSEEYDALMPPADCEGGDNCRGVIVVLDNTTTDAMSEDAG